MSMGIDLSTRRGSGMDSHKHELCAPRALNMLLLKPLAPPTCHASIQSGVKAWRMCFPLGASEGSRREGRDMKMVPCISSILQPGSVV